MKIERNGTRTLGLVVSTLAIASCAPRTSHQPERATSSAQAVLSAAPRAPEPVPPGAMRVATFNAGLAPGVIAYAGARAPRVVEELASVPLDLLCVQEFWLEEHWQSLVSATAARMPHTYRASRPAVTTRCSSDELRPLEKCVSERCAGKDADSVASCVVARCAAVATQVSAGCLDCLIERPLGDLDTIAGRCRADEPTVSSRPSSKARTTAQPKPTKPIAAFGGSSGTGLLSREPLTDRDVIEFTSEMSNRSALYAKMSRPDGPVHVVCTHLGTGEQEQHEQLERVLAWVGQKTADGAPVLLLGDLNIGPELPRNGVRPRHLANLARLNDLGFRSVYAEQPGARCTYCDSNPLNGGIEGEGGTLIDHVFLKGPLTGSQSTRLLEKKIEVRVSGQPLRTAPSDHYGLAVTVQTTRTQG